MAPKRRDASEFGVNYTSPKKPRAERADGTVEITTSFIWIREVQGGLLTILLRDAPRGTAFRTLLKDVREVAPALVQPNQRSGVMTAWRINFGNAASEWTHVLQIPTSPREDCSDPPQTPPYNFPLVSGGQLLVARLASGISLEDCLHAWANVWSKCGERSAISCCNLAGRAGEAYLEILRAYDIHVAPWEHNPPPYVPSFPPIQAFVKLVQDQAALLIESNWARFKQVLVNQAYFKMEVTPPCPPNQTHSALLHPMGDISSKTPHPSLES